MTSMALCPWVAWRPVLTGDLERTSWRRCPSHYLIHSFTNQRRARSAQAGAVEVSPRSEEHSCSHTLRGSEGDEEDPLHPIDRCAQKSEAGRGVLKENKAGRALHSRSRTPEVTAGDVLCSSHRPFKPWCTGAGLPLFTPTHNCSHPLTLAHTCSHSHLLTSTTPAHTHSHLLTRANSLCLFPTSAFRDVTWNLELSSSGSVYTQPSANTANQA